MSDDELIDVVAQAWIAGGGDAEGMAYCWEKIKERITELSETPHD
jgi:hypothetical protein